MVTRLRKINPVQFALVTAIMYGLVSLIFALAMLPFSAMLGTLGTPGTAHIFGAISGVALVIVLPIFYFVLTFVFGLIGAAVYNLVASWTGGIEVTLESTVGVPAPASGYTV